MLDSSRIDAVITQLRYRLERIEESIVAFERMAAAGGATTSRRQTDLRDSSGDHSNKRPPGPSVPVQ